MTRTPNEGCSTQSVVHAEAWQAEGAVLSRRKRRSDVRSDEIERQLRSDGNYQLSAERRVFI